MNTNTQKANETKQTKQPTTSTNESRRDDDQFSNDWWREFAETWK
ncbi:MAG TPA: hypothetical protein VGD69_01035 [Herpetosiphonaceae bacterium]